MLLGFLMGAALAAYMYLSPRSIGYAFPNINGEHSVRPSFARISVYLIGRWFGYVFIGVLFSWLGTWLDYSWFERIITALCVLFGIYILLFVIINDSPELVLAIISDPSKLSIPLFIKGFLSAGILLSPLIIAMGFVAITYQQFSSAIFFTNIFFGNTLISLPKLLNMKWDRSVYFTSFLRAILLLCASFVLILSIEMLLKI